MTIEKIQDSYTNPQKFAQNLLDTDLQSRLVDTLRQKRIEFGTLMLQFKQKFPDSFPAEFPEAKFDELRQLIALTKEETR